MKNKFNLIKGLWNDSHEKQTPQTFGRYVVMLLMLLTLGVGQMWANNTQSTFYVAIDPNTLGNDCNNVQFNICYCGDCNYGGEGWTLQSMTRQNATFNGKVVYKATYTFPYDGYHAWQFWWGGSYKDAGNAYPKGEWATDLHNGKIYVVGSGWETYSADPTYDLTVYFIDRWDWSAPKAHIYNTDCDKVATWPGVTMTSTGQTYNGYDIYSYSASYTLRYANVIFSDNGSDTHKSDRQDLGTTHNNQMYHWNGSADTWDAAQYDIAFDEEGATSSGSYPSKALVGSTMPTLTTAPSKTGYTFGGYYDGDNGTGTKYWNANLTGAKTCAIDGPNQFYAKWLPQSLTITAHPDYLTTTDKLTLSIDYANIPSGYCYRVKVGAGYYNNSSGQNRDAISGTGSTSFTSYSGLPLGTNTVVVELWKDSPFEKQSVVSNEVTVTVEQAYLVNVLAKTDGVESTTGGTVSPASVNASLHLGQTITAEANVGYDFTGWTANTVNITFDDDSELSTTVYATAGGWVYANYKRQSSSYSTTFYAGDHGSINAKGTAIAKNGSASVTIGENETLSATPESAEYVFDHWGTTGSVTVTDIYSASTTVTATDAGGTVTAYYRHVPVLGAVTATPSGQQNYAGSSIDFALSVTSTYLAHPVVVFLVNDGTTTYEVVGAPYGADGSSAAGTIGSDAAYTTVHKATFTASEAKTYTVSAKLYEGLLLANWDGKDFTGGGGWYDNNGGHTKISNPAIQANNASATVHSFTKGSNWWDVPLYWLAATEAYNTGHNYRYIHTRQYSEQSGAPKLKVSDHKGNLATGNSFSANQWCKLTYDNYRDGTERVDFFFPLFENGNTTVYIDDIILSNEASMTEKASQAATASFSINKDYTVTLNNNGATSAGTESVNVTYGSATGITDITVPTKTGYTFGGYYTEDAGAGTLQINASGVWQNAGYVADGKWHSGSNQTLYAKWTENDYTVTVNAGSNGSVASGSVTGHYDTKVTLPTATANTGYHFSTWTTTSGSVTYTNQTSATAAQVNGLTAAATVRADFAANTYSVVFNGNGKTGGSMSNQSFTYDAAAKALTSNSFTKTGYTFVGWATSAARANAMNIDYTNGQSVQNLTSTHNGTFNLYAVWAKKYYIGGRFQHDWEDGTTTTNEMTYDTSTGYYKFTTNKTVSELSVQWHNVSGNYDEDQVFFIHTGNGKTGSSSNPFYTTPNEDGAGLNFETCNSYANALVLANQETTWGEIVKNRLVQFSNTDNLSSNVIVWWEPATKKIWYTATESLNTNYFLLGFGSGSWGETEARRFKVATVNATTATVSVSLTAKTYETNTEDGFKVEKGGTYYGYSNTMTRANCTAGWVFADGQNNCGITADLAGTYTFTLNLSTMAVTATYPTAYQLNYSIGSVAGTDGSITTVPSTASGSYVGSGNSVTLTGPAAKTGYTWKGWYTNAAGTEGKIADTDRAITVTMDADKTLYACYSETMHDVTVNAETGGTVSYNGGAAGSSCTARAGIATASANIVATASTGYYFIGWSLPDGTITKASESAYNGATSTCTINATADSKTVTALFGVRYALLGSRDDAPTDTPAGMPGWGEGNEAPFTYSAGTSTYTKTVYLTVPNEMYKFRIVDRRGASHTSYGLSSKAVVAADGSYHDLASTNADAQLATAGVGTYTLYVQTNGSDKPKVKIVNPLSHLITMGTMTDYGTGGSITAVDGEATPNPISNGKYIKDGGSIVVTASKNTGYTFAGWFSDAQCTIKLEDDEDAVELTYTKTGLNGAKSIYAKFTENRTTVNLSASPAGKGTFTCGGDAVTSVSAGVTTHPAVTAVPATGYRVNTSATVWSKDNNYVTLSSTTANPVTITGTGTTDNSTALTATFTPKTYTITLNQNGATTSSSPTSLTATYDARANGASDVFTLTNPERTGYTFNGWFESAGGTGAEIITTAKYYKWEDNPYVTTTGLWQHDGDVTVYAKWTPNNYTVSFDVNGGTASTPDSKEVTFGSAYGTLPSGMTHASKQFIGWYDDADEGEGNHITAETIVSTASDHTLYAHYENVYSVNVNFKCGDATIYPATSVEASPTSLTPTITAPEIFGYTFKNWTGTNVTPADASSATTTITATAATTITANYDVVPTVYFKNNLGWDSVFVSFNCSFVEGKEYAPSNNGKPYYAMKQIGSTDIYYCEIPSTYTDGDYAGWAWNIAFDNTNYGKTAATTHTGTWSEFYGGECVGRGDFDPKATLYIPYKEDTESRNTCTFYKTGCWMKYNSTESGYQVKMNTWVTGEHADTLTVNLEAANAGGYEYSAKLNLTHANYSYGFKLYKPYKKNTTDLWYTNTGAIYATTDDLPWDFKSGSSINANSQRCELHTEALGDYTITVSFATGRPMVSVEYPTSVGDWRLAYNDRIAWSGDAHDASWYLYSRVIKAKANAEDLVSFYVSKADGANAHIELQKCTAIDAGSGAETWTKQGDNLNLSGITGTGIYNFKVTQNGSKVATAAYDGAYDGNFYIRTDASDGGWNNYISSGKNIMTYSEYAKDNSGFTHYFTRFINSGTNIKFCIANDYSSCLTEYCIDDDFTGEYIEADGNVRFMWDQRTNAVSRAYISGSTTVSDRFLVLEGDAKLFNENGIALTSAAGGQVAGLNEYEMNFGDDQNWIYEATVKAQPKAKVKLTAKYNNKIQYFYGDEGSTAADSVLLIDGTGTDKYKMRIVYDFKTNRLIKAFIPDGDIGTNLAIDADLMIIREHQGTAQQVTFSEGGALSKVKTVYGAMKFNKYTVNGKEKTGGHAGTGASRYERDLFYISFPFDVKLNEAFGFGTYGKHWILEYYDGKGRAANGFWADSDPNWKFVTPAQRNNGFVMKAFEGYILALDLDEMTESSEVWDNGVEDVYIYFPSTAEVEDIEATNRLIKIDQKGYECTINRNTPQGDRRVLDSYWHCIGVPSFANYNGTLYDIEDEETRTAIDWRSTSMPYLYTINWADKSLSITSSATFSFKATYSYMVQYADSTIYWSQVNATPSSVVARERTAPMNTEFRIELQKNGQKDDQTFVRLSDDENVTTGFDFNYDLSKEFNKNKANIYTMVTTIMDDGPSITQTAGNVLPMSEQTTVVPVGVKIASTGDYTFAIPEGTNGVGVTLIDNETGIRTSLSALDYTINLPAGTYDNRFVLEISPIVQSPTGIESTEHRTQNTDVHKVLIDNILYIVKDGVMYDARGARVQ